MKKKLAKYILVQSMHKYLTLFYSSLFVVYFRYGCTH